MVLQKMGWWKCWSCLRTFTGGDLIFFVEFNDDDGDGYDDGDVDEIDYDDGDDDAIDVDDDTDSRMILLNPMMMMVMMMKVMKVTLMILRGHLHWRTL